MRSVRDTISLLKSACAGVFLAAASFAVHGQTPTVYTEAGQLIRAPQAVTSLGPDLFGDKVNLYSGVLEFTQTDVSIPGNNALPVSVGRRLSTGNWANATGAFGRWELEIPHLHGVFASAGWVTKAGNNNRCTEFGAPAGAKGVGGIAMWSAEDFWHGNFIYVPGVGDQEMLMRDARNANIPSSGGPYPVVTRDLWAFRCLPTLANDPAGTMGQGFLAIAPDGTQYRFDQLVTRNYEGVSRVEDMSPSLAADATASADAPPPANIATCCGLGRKEVWILPTRVTDRFGNYVSYTYSAAKPANVTSIVSSDGRRLTLTYIADIDGERVSSVSDGTRTWTYAYHGVNEQTDLARVTLPDGSSWNLGDISALLGRWHYLVSGDCDTLGTVAERPMVGTMVHPSGAIGQFTLTAVRHGRSQTYRQCRGNSDVATYAVNPHKYDTFSLTSKTLSGPGMPATSWSYDYGPDNGSWEGCTGCMETVTTSVTDPNGERTEYTFGNHHRRNEGRLLSTNTGGMRTVSMHYRDANAGPYPSVPGHSDQTRGDSAVNAQFAPVDQRITRQQGVDFSWQASAFDTRARALIVTRSSSLGYSRTETTAYFDQPATWVLGQVQSVTEGSTGKAMVSTAYQAANATPLSVSRFGQLQQSYTYASDGTLQTIKDGNNRTTTYSDYKRGLAQTIRYPDNTVERAVVSDLGLVSALTNQVGTTTSYGYDAMGRLASITHPGADSVAWNATTIAFAPVAGVEYGIGAGHWRQTVTTGNRLDVQYFDALWRPVLSRSYDAANEAATRKMVTRRFDFRGNSAFESYPQRTIGAVTDAVAGVATTYDALGRATLVSASSELGTLNTVTGYTSGFEKSVRNARNQVTTMRFQAFDEPSDGAISNIGAPEGVTVAIARDVFGKPTSVTRSGAAKSAARRYVYDSYQRLCKSIEPETGATVQDYDGANNVAWRASGLALPATASCDTASVPAARKISYGYDLRNRLTGTSFGDASPAITRTYTDDGLPSTIASNGAVWTNSYNKRRLNERESLAYGGVVYNIDRAYDANGALLQLKYPDNTVVGYNPNALGEPRQVGAYASAIAYHPNGALAAFRYGGGIAHSTTQNLRGLPSTSVDGGVISDEYTYDANGNVSAIADRLQPSVSSRTMTYDNLDRLRTVGAPALWGSAAYTYDALDNLTATTISAGSTARGTVHTINPATNRLDSIANGPPGFNFTYSYDSQGNIIRRGAQAYVFDQGNRMRSAAGKATYGYDGLGHRMTVVGTDGVNRVQVYSQEGQLLYVAPSGGTATKYIYLHKHVLAEVTGATTTYDHTDALGSPVAQSNASGAVINRTRYEPYGYVAVGSARTIGFTGHVNDNDTGLIYMQQRYYDPFAGRMLSIDPVTTDANTGGSFNRYAYANNSPYSYVDPDGRDTYRLNRDLRVFGSSARSINNPISHTLTATTDSNGNVVHTYSWGNDANLKGWNLDQPLDMSTASEAIKNDLAEKVGDSKLDPFVAKEFEKLNKKENEHSNHIVTDNCKTETTKLLNGAKQAQEGPKKPPEPKKPDPLRPSERPGRE